MVSSLKHDARAIQGQINEQPVGMWIFLYWLPGALEYQSDFGMGDMIFLGMLLFTNKKNTLFNHLGLMQQIIYSFYVLKNVKHVSNNI